MHFSMTSESSETKRVNKNLKLHNHSMEHDCGISQEIPILQPGSSEKITNHFNEDR
jgi:hypothetical protein